ncbi:TolC family protein, partial [Francisella tularensis subsp. holarctica]|nr:TolC family protein [Francisella tularensis subsp. holarctica]
CASSIANPEADYPRTINQSINNSPQYKFIGFQLNSSQMSPAIQLGRLLPIIDIGGSITATNILDKRTIADGDIDGGIFDSIQGLVSLTQPLYDYGAY